jgi:hypothetical protein
LQDGGCRWERNGKWALSFTGRAHLDAWVGLSTDPDSIGHLCCCDAVAVPTGCDEQCPARKLSKEKLFSEDPTDKHVGAKASSASWSASLSRTTTVLTTR